ncbi:MAG: hypothetical protein DRG24_05290 [Epsilonproteobacteria bacterium]|nr:MAG: hypothetical protein DRG24_05290 [Campylobacterota bacterium]
MKFQIKPAKKMHKTDVLLLGKDSRIAVSYNKVDLILSPSLYWFREEILPAKNVPQAKKLAPSLFDAIAPEGIYNYHAQKHQDLFWLFAYDETAIAQAITDAGLRLNQVRNIYFAQNECAPADKALQIDKENVLVNNEGAISLLPLKYVQESVDAQMFFETHPRSKHKITINLFQNSLLDEKQINRLIALAILFIVIYLGAFIMQKQQYKLALTKQYALNETYQLPPTSFQLKGLIKSLESKQKRQLDFRARLNKIFKLSLKKGEYIQKFEATIKKLSLEIHLNDVSRAEGIKSELQKLIRITSAKVKNKTFYVSGTHE